MDVGHGLPDGYVTSSHSLTGKLPGASAARRMPSWFTPNLAEATRKVIDRRAHCYRHAGEPNCSWAPKAHPPPSQRRYYKPIRPHINRSAPDPAVGPTHHQYQHEHHPLIRQPSSHDRRVPPRAENGAEAPPPRRSGWRVALHGSAASRMEMMNRSRARTKSTEAQSEGPAVQSSASWFGVPMPISAALRETARVGAFLVGGGTRRASGDG